MDTAKDHGSAALAGNSSQSITTQRVAGVHANANHIAWGDGKRVKLVKRFIANDRVAVSGRRSGGQNIKPAGSYYSRSKGSVARVHKVHFQGGLFSENMFSILAD